MALTSKITAIADAIRSKTGGTEKLTLNAMPTEITNIPTGSYDIEDALVTRSLSGEYTNNRIVTIGHGALSWNNSLTSIDLPAVTYIESSAFSYCHKLTSVNLPVATSIGSSAFTGDDSLTSVNLPAVTTIESSAFSNCSALTTVNFLPAVTYIRLWAFSNCSALTSIDLPAVTTIEDYVFYNCDLLTSVIIRTTSQVCILDGASVFTNSPIASGTGYIYVPDELVESYKAATNWSTYADQIKPLSEYVEA